MRDKKFHKCGNYTLAHKAVTDADGGENVMENVNCLRCHFRHKDNGNCTAVGGFCTAVPAAYCPLLREYLDGGVDNACL